MGYLRSSAASTKAGSGPAVDVGHERCPDLRQLSAPEQPNTSFMSGEGGTSGHVGAPEDTNPLQTWLFDDEGDAPD